MLIQPFSYFAQPVAAAGAGYIIRSDTNASSVTVAIPGTKFGTTFNQNSYRSDISGYINGGSSFADAALTGSGQTTSTTTKWTTADDGYETSMSRPSNSNMGCLPGTVSNINFGSGAFTIETWFRISSSGNSTWLAWQYNAGFGFFGWSNEGYYRWVAQNSSLGETLYDFTSTPADNTWYHLAFCRSGSSWYCCFDGTIKAVLTLSGNTGTTAGFQIGGRITTMETTLLQDFRVTKGVARYTGTAGSSYTKPSSIVTKG